MAAALGAMVSRLAKLDSAAFEEDRRFFTDAVDRDSEAFQGVMAAYQRSKPERAPLVEEALRGAARVPLEVLERASGMLRRLEALHVPAKFASDVAAARALTAAAKTGALENVLINLEAMQDEASKTAIKSRLPAATR
jgi:formiminotetrahydrofolate cyclodeaminase